MAVLKVCTAVAWQESEAFAEKGALASTALMD